MIIRSESQIPIALDMLKQSLTWTYDVESTGVNIRKDKIIGFGAVRPDTLQGFYIITQEWKDGELHTVLSREAVRPVIESLARKRLLMYNAGFDCGMTLFDYGINLDGALWSDVMLQIHTCNENLPNYGLKTIAAREFGVNETAQQSRMVESIKANGGSGKGEILRADSALVAEYGLQDNILTARLWNRYEQDLKRQGLYNFFYKDEVMPLLKHVTMPMERGGVPLDLPLIQSSDAEIRAEIEALETKIQSALAPLLDGFNDWYIRTKYPFKMSGEFRQALARRFAPPNWPRTETGTYSFSKASIDKAIKRGEIPADTQLQAWAQEESASERVPAELVREIQLELMALDGIKTPFLLSSTDHLKRLFFGSSTTKSVLNEQPVSRTDKGNPQVDDEFLETMAAKYEWAKDLQTLRSLWKLHGTYISQYLESQEDGVFYPRWSQHRTVSGRYSGDLQQLPKKLSDENSAPEVVKRFTNRIRDFFIAGPGFKLIGDDYESLEPKLFSHTSGDPGLIGIFNKGHDFYSTIAIGTENLKQYSPDKKAPNYLGKLDPDKRQAAKEYSLGIPYGKSAYALQFSLGCPIEDAIEKREAYLNAFPKMKEWMETSEETAIRQGYIRTELGRIRRFPGLPKLILDHGRSILDPLEMYAEHGSDPKQYAVMKPISGKARNWLNNAKNVQIQALAASVVNRSGIALSKIFAANPHWCAYLCMQVHDEWVVRCKAEYAEDAAAAMRTCLEGTVKLSLPLIAEPTIADVYGDTK